MYRERMPGRFESGAVLIADLTGGGDGQAYRIDLTGLIMHS